MFYFVNITFRKKIPFENLTFYPLSVVRIVSEDEINRFAVLPNLSVLNKLQQKERMEM